MTVFDDIRQAIMYLEIILYVIVRSSAEKPESTGFGAQAIKTRRVALQLNTEYLTGTHFISLCSSNCIVFVRWSGLRL